MIRFDGQVAVVTGAGRGLGRPHAAAKMGIIGLSRSLAVEGDQHGIAEVFIGTRRDHFDPALTPEDVHAHVAAALDHQDFELPADAMAEVAITASLVLAGVSHLPGSPAPNSPFAHPFYTPRGIRCWLEP